MKDSTTVKQRVEEALLRHPEPLSVRRLSEIARTSKSHVRKAVSDLRVEYGARLDTTATRHGVAYKILPERGGFAGPGRDWFEGWISPTTGIQAPRLGLR